jgi:hypothetical protein
MMLSLFILPPFAKSGHYVLLSCCFLPRPNSAFWALDDNREKAEKVSRILALISACAYATKLQHTKGEFCNGIKIVCTWVWVKAHRGRRTENVYFYFC